MRGTVWCAHPRRVAFMVVGDWQIAEPPLITEMVGRSGLVWTGWPVSRVLWSATIHLGPWLPTVSSDLPVHSGGQPSSVHCLVLLRVGFA